MKSPRIWTKEELIKDAYTARDRFRQGRLQETLDLYTEFFDEFKVVFEEMIGKLDAIRAEPVDRELLSVLMAGRVTQKAFRYLAAPPISADDLKALADTSLASTNIKGDAEAAKSIRDVVLSVIDPFRFPWVEENRKATPSEFNAAVVASAALAAAREVETKRRNESKDIQEAAVKKALVKAGFIEVPKRDIPMLTAAPEPGHFCGESAVAGTRADIVVRLKDSRVLAMECKVSNSSVNSYKRLVHEAAGKATTWYNQLGKAQVVAAAVLSGVYSPQNLITAQDTKNCFIFWQHRLKDLQDFVKA